MEDLKIPGYNIIRSSFNEAYPYEVLIEFDLVGRTDYGEKQTVEKSVFVKTVQELRELLYVIDEINLIRELDLSIAAKIIPFFRKFFDSQKYPKRFPYQENLAAFPRVLKIMHHQKSGTKTYWVVKGK